MIVMMIMVVVVIIMEAEYILLVTVSATCIFSNTLHHVKGLDMPDFLYMTIQGL
jgi:hypothetical protein